MATSSQAVIPSDPARLLPKFNPNQTFTAPKTTVTGTTATTPPAAGASGLSATQQSVFDLMAQTLASWGLSALLPDLKNLVLGGDTAPDTLALALSQTDAYKQRFAGNAMRVAAGMTELTPAQYIGLEDSYRQVLSQYGLPKGFYDQNSDFDQWIAGDVSPAELQSRAQIAKEQYLNAPQEFRDYWANYGLKPGDAVASILDPKHESLADLQLMANAVNVGGSALQQGINVAGSRAMDLAKNGVTLEQARAGYQRIAAVGQTDSMIAKRFGTTFDQTAEENDLLLNHGADTAKRSLIYSEEAAQFGGHGGASTAGVSVGGNY
jgi:hypothetical protein